ncbi:MAG: 3-isopropylmalate dehydratase large subunit, partial [Betaproteobacteria bacterium]|nr:3-isopropylmalate dehydratase large subunit [Betaproteobacteria bacterium]
WRRHMIVARGETEALLHTDRNFVHEGSFHAFDALRLAGRTVRKPRQTFGFADHYVPTLDRDRGLAGIADGEARHLVEFLAKNAQEFGFESFDINDPHQGIVHVVGPELGLTQPGLVITCGDSHTSTHGALGAYAFGIGANQLEQILATQALWVRKPRTMRITVDGKLARGVTAKDVILAVIARIGAGGAVGHVVEYAGSTIAAMSMEGRLTICNMSIEAGGRAGMVAPDDTTYAYFAGRPYAPKGADWDKALVIWRILPSDPEAHFDREVALDAGALAPMVTWGTSPEHAAPITGIIPDPAGVADATRRAGIEQALRYMDLKPGTPLAAIKVDRVFIGSCTNSRIEDLRAAAVIARGRKAVIPAMVSPGSTQVKREAEAEGLDRVFREAGFEWRASGCSMCVGINGDLVPAGERCASTSNRNFEGRQGKGARTHLVSPAMAAAAAVTGKLTDVRTLLSQA